METSSSHHDNSNATQETEVQKLIKNFGSYTTLHGLHFLFESSSAVRRILWIILMVACMLILAFQLKYCYLKLQSHESLVTKDIEYSKSFLFPAVTICNQNMLLKSKILGTDAQKYLDNIDNLKYVSRRINSSFNILEVAKEAGHNLTVMMKRCSWRGQRCGPENFTSFATLLRGLCYTFNSGQPGHPLVNATALGISQALSLILDVQPEEYYGPFSYDATGIKLVLHEQYEWPQVENLGIDLTPGYNTNIRIKRNKHIALKPPFRPPCGTRKLITSNIYSSSRCLMECGEKKLMEICSCSLPTMLLGETFSASKICSAQEIRDCILPNTGLVTSKNCDCPVECEQVLYSSSLSSAFFPSTHYWDSIYQLLNDSSTNKTKVTITEVQEAIRRRILKVNIFYEDMSTDITRIKPAYGIFDFASDIGGSMGLFLGCSFLTLCEFLDLLIMVCIKYFPRKSNYQLKSSAENHRF
ncbi:hypothetical protein ABFA07_017989 [Porites harrisoni]